MDDVSATSWVNRVRSRVSGWSPWLVELCLAGGLLVTMVTLDRVTGGTQWFCIAAPLLSVAVGATGASALTEDWHIPAERSPVLYYLVLPGFVLLASAIGITLLWNEPHWQWGIPVVVAAAAAYFLYMLWLECAWRRR
ncbi:MAG TPA: hypothetical protein VNK48_14310 [Xanthobacteraceae bacterium]|nr:hypothetical protein [Xanthobacteraceae bacterium]